MTCDYTNQTDTGTGIETKDSHMWLRTAPPLLCIQVVKESLIDAFYKLTDSKSQITSYVFDVVRSTVPKIELDD
eukprot:scaffold358810_cov43-Prasinocladus_malaysianus.AAC.1